jgi:hypothetical protein
LKTVDEFRMNGARASPPRRRRRCAVFWGAVPVVTTVARILRCCDAALHPSSVVRRVRMSAERLFRASRSAAIMV